MTFADFHIVLPEALLAIYAMAALLFGVYTGKDKVAGVITWGTAGLFALMALYIGMKVPAPQTAFGGMFVDDAFAQFVKVAILLSAAAVLVIGQDYMRRYGWSCFEYPVLVTLSVVGMMMMVSAGDLMALYMGLELQSLALYVLATIRRDHSKSTEAGLKYFVLGALSSGLLLYGASLIYGYAGTTLFGDILSTMKTGLPLGVLFGLVFMLAGLAFKISAVPFHMWTPDVYEGSPTPVTTFFATAPKFAAMALFARLVYDAFGPAHHDWVQIVALLSLLSMFVGAIAAIGQRDIKRLMSYSSIAHMGYALMGLCAGTIAGVQAMLIYMSIYVVMNIGTFAFILSMERGGKPVTDISALNMLVRREPLKAYAMLALLVSLAGIPPMLGFFGKFAVLKAAVDAGLVWLAVAGVVASVIGAFYYLRLVYYMFFGTEGDGMDSNASPAQWLALVGAALVMVLGIINMFGVDPAAALAAQALVH